MYWATQTSLQAAPMNTLGCAEIEPNKSEYYKVTGRDFSRHQAAAKRKLTDPDGVQDLLTQNMAPWYIEHFHLKGV